MKLTTLAAIVLLLAGDAPVNDQVQAPTAAPPAAEINTMAARFAPADIRADLSALPANERRALSKLVDAARIMDSLFLKQVWAGNDAMLQELGHAAVSQSRGTTAASGASADLAYARL